MLTFIIPVRHPANAKNWSMVKTLLSETARSIANQDHKDWRAVVVANDGADLPDLPPGFEVKRVQFPPNANHDFGKDDRTRDAVNDSFRYDKGRRVLAGMLHARTSEYFMPVDDDDLVSRRLAGFVADNPDAIGWYFKNGYVWTSDGHHLFLHNDFNKLCGTCHIFRADTMDLPKTFDDASEIYIKRMLGSHSFVDVDLLARGVHLQPLPFVGAVYRIGHPGSHSVSKALVRSFVLTRKLVVRPWKMVRNLLSIRRLTRQDRAEFFGGESA